MTYLCMWVRKFGEVDGGEVSAWIWFERFMTFWLLEMARWVLDECGDVPLLCPESLGYLRYPDKPTLDFLSIEFSSGSHPVNHESFSQIRKLLATRYKVSGSGLT